MTERVEWVLERLTRVPGVQGVMVVDTDAGVPVATELASDLDETALAALAGSLYTRTTEASLSAGLGAVDVLQMEAATGHVVVAGGGPLLVVVVTEAAAQLGLVRVEAERAAGELNQ